MDEHYEILDIAGDVRRLLAADDRHGAATELDLLDIDSPRSVQFLVTRDLRPRSGVTEVSVEAPLSRGS